jgi:hypothetical protein
MRQCDSNMEQVYQAAHLTILSAQFISNFAEQMNRA